MKDEKINGQRIRVYDNGGVTFDRFTVIYLDAPEGYNHFGQLYNCVGMNAAPFHRQGICQHGIGLPGRHLGRRIPFAYLPEDCQTAVKKDLTR